MPLNFKIINFITNNKIKTNLNIFHPYKKLTHIFFKILILNHNQILKRKKFSMMIQEIE
jgi:hypothetical protein